MLLHLLEAGLLAEVTVVSVLWVGVWRIVEERRWSHLGGHHGWIHCRRRCCLVVDFDYVVSELYARLPSLVRFIN